MLSANRLSNSSPRRFQSRRKNLQTLYIEDKLPDRNPYAFMMNWKLWKNEQPIAPRKEMTSNEAYTNDMYSKGAYVLHTLRYYVGDETFKMILRRWAYPDPEMEKVTDGRQCRFATTDEFLKYFGLNNLSDLPKPRELDEIMQDEDFIEQKRKIMMTELEEKLEESIGEESDADDQDK